MSLFNWISIPALGDERGSLAAIEANKTLPIDFKRIYYIFNTKPGVARGFHAHKALKQMVICLVGKCRIILDNGNVREEAWLDSPTKGILIEGLLWREMHDFSDDCVLLVLADAHYDESDYIREYKVFIKTVMNNKREDIL